MSSRSLADQVRAILVKRAFVPGDPSMAGGGAMPPGGDPAAGGAAAAGGMPADPAAAAAGGMPADPAAAGAMPADPMGGIPGGAAPVEGAPVPSMINMTADEFTKFIKQMMQAFSGGAAPQQQVQPDIGAKLDTLIAVLQGQKAAPAAAPAAAVQA